METELYRSLRCLCVLMLAVVIALLSCVFAAWFYLRPTAGEWSASLPLWRGAHAFHLNLSVPRMLQAATDPRFARFLDGRSFDTPAGRVRMHWQAKTHVLTAQCDPCLLKLAALGERPMALRGAEFSMRRDGDWRLSGHLTSGAVVLPWRGRLSAKALELEGDLAATEIASVYALFGAAIPELRRARIEGRVSAAWRLQLPSVTWSVKPAVEGFRVGGLGTEVLLNAELPGRCATNGPPSHSRWLERALIASEDRRFFEHPGYDLDETIASFQANQNARAIQGGGSTLSQQLAKQLFAGDERSAVRKLRELLYAVEMERTLGKGRILQLYLAIAPWGPGICGAPAAARRYLGKPASKLDAVEAAWLVSLLPRPMDTPAVERERIAVIVTSMTGTTLRQRLGWLEMLPGWQPAAP